VQLGTLAGLHHHTLALLLLLLLEGHEQGC
jgi:hypothetical protein